MDLIEQSSAWLDGERRRFMSRPVTYSRAGDSAEVLATVGRTTFDVSDEYGIAQHWESRDYLVLAADLAGFGLPQRGDRITETVSGQTLVYEVLAPGGETPWRWSDAYHRTLRIHTKQVGAA